MSALDAALRQIETDLRTIGSAIALIGGLAVSVRAEPRTTRDDRGVVVGLLFASSGIEEEIVAAADRLEVMPATWIPVATTAHLLALKVLAGRRQDQADAVALLEEMDSSELARCREALALIEERGFARGKDLGAELRSLLAEPRDLEQIRPIVGHGGEVVLVWAPTNPLVARMISQNLPLEELWESLADEPGVRLVDARPGRGFSSFQTVDGLHLRGRDAAQFTRGLAAALARQESPTRR